MQITSKRTRTGTRVEIVEWGGHKWRRYPDAKAITIRKYLRRCERRGGKRLRTLWLHKEVWKNHNGKIPKGMDIHHKDENTANNEIDNLELLTPTEHQAKHRDHIKKAAEAAKGWHASDEGRQWHSEHAKRQWAETDAKEHVCERCGKRFEARKKYNVRYCSNNCRSYARKERGDDNEQRTCANCGATFTINRYAKKECCSASCAAKRRWKNRQHGATASLQSIDVGRDLLCQRSLSF